MERFYNFNGRVNFKKMESGKTGFFGFFQNQGEQEQNLLTPLSEPFDESCLTWLEQGHYNLWACVRHENETCGRHLYRKMTQVGMNWEDHDEAYVSA